MVLSSRTRQQHPVPKLQQRKAVFDRVVRVADDEQFLQRLKNRVDRVEIDLPTVEVRYENIKVDAEIYVGTRGLPTVLNSTINIIEGLLENLHILGKKRSMTILHDISGIIKPQRMTLLLGPPGSGKTTFLLALAGKLLHDLKVSGTVTYNGHGFNEFVPQRTAAYISQYDEHLGELTVRETLAFSARCQGIGNRYRRLLELLKREKEAHIKPDPDLDLLTKAAVIGGHKADVVTDYVLKILGLENCADTIVGNQMLRGISGGEKKRVTTGEMMVTSIKDQRQYWMHRKKPYNYVPVRAFSEAFQKFHVGQALSEELSIPFDKSRSHPDALTKSKYGASMKELLKATFCREVLLMKRNSFIYIFKACQVSSL
ncbi:Drug resistance transporter-like ABC domain protein [Rhynchospora pubera]|uniref:Drug resistance transporter-like ABC domain protein n=1 Tax=Rhynchospora pubera TaxID=906938 RepID=A0AAV8CMJ9_9POAL|nr:Drug resistance transporter-like ABC domain protein [Rhynchospora pubera]